MTIKSTFLDGIIYTELFGEIDYNSVIQQIDFTLSLKDKIVNRFELHDHTHTKRINLSADAIRKIAIYSNKTKDIFKLSFLAVYAPNDFTFGIARMFETFYEMEKHPINARIFRSKEAAVEFLKEKMNEHGC